MDAFCLLPGHPLLALAAEGQAPLLGKVLENGGDPDARDSRGYTGAARLLAVQEIGFGLPGRTIPPADAIPPLFQPHQPGIWRQRANQPATPAICPICSHLLAALHLACWHARLACVRVLLEAGASLQVVDAAGRTAGELAQAAGHADVADMLRQHEEVQRALREQRLKQLEHSQEQAEMVDAAC